MVLFGQTGSNWANWLYFVKLVLLCKMVVFGQKVLIFWQKLLYLGKIVLSGPLSQVRFSELALAVGLQQPSRKCLKVNFLSKFWRTALGQRNAFNSKNTERNEVSFAES